jgi:predicted acetylornithine/succinylornithine family transaminase
VSTDWINVEKKYYAQTVRRQPIVIIRGKGSKVWDVDGKEYLDFTAGWAVCNIGHNHPALVEAIQEQAQQLIQTSNAYYTIPQLKLAKILIDNSSLDRIFLCHSGLEANEGAIKLARRYGLTKRDGAYEIITALNSFHGRSVTTIAATGQAHYQEKFKPLTSGFVHVEFNDLSAIMEATSHKTAAVFLEPVQGEGGVNIPSNDYLKNVQTWCRQHNILFMLDEVQTGMGRLGSLFGYQEFDVQPDVMTLAKGLGGGVPIGAFMSTNSAMSLTYGDHGSTFGGNPLTSAAAYAVTKHIIDNDLAANARTMGKYLMNLLEGLKSQFSFITEIRGRGLLIAIEFDDDISARVLEKTNHAGILLNAVKPNALRLMPALNITTEEITQGVERIEKALTQL